MERWLTARLSENIFDTLHHLPLRAESCLRMLPKQHRDRLMRAFAAEALLAHLLGDDDSEWIAKLLDDKVVEPDAVLHALTQHDDADDARARRAAGLGAVLLTHGVQPASLARTTMFGTWMGNESSRYKRLRAAFEALKVNGNPQAGAVRAAGMELFAELRDRALAEERQERIEGRL